MHELALGFASTGIRVRHAYTSRDTRHVVVVGSCLDLMGINLLAEKYLRCQTSTIGKIQTTITLIFRAAAPRSCARCCRAAGRFPRKNSLSTVWKRRLERRAPTPDIPWVDVATGSARTGFPNWRRRSRAGQCGIYLDQLPYHVCSRSQATTETAEGLCGRPSTGFTLFSSTT